MFKGELNLDNKWRSDDLFLYNNERNLPSFQPILRDFKVIIIYLKNLLTFKYLQFSLIPLSMAVDVCKQEQQWSARMAHFYAATIKYLCRSCGKRKNVTFFLLDVFLHPD